jgi:catechol 2,3-dioxygenase-like lactoylglutathione lyase family enzyme
MLANVPVCATLTTTDLERAKRFYGEALGLTEAAIGVDGGVFFKAGGESMLRITSARVSTRRPHKPSPPSSSRTWRKRCPSCAVEASHSRSTTCHT